MFPIGVSWSFHFTCLLIQGTLLEKQRNITRLTIDLKRHPGSSENYYLNWHPTEKHLSLNFKKLPPPFRHSFITSIIYTYIYMQIYGIVYSQPTNLYTQIHGIFATYSFAQKKTSHSCFFHLLVPDPLGLIAYDLHPQNISGFVNSSWSRGSNTIICD